MDKKVHNEKIIFPPYFNESLNKKESIMVKLGDIAKDSITDFEGTVTAIYTYLYGCRRVQLTPKLGAKKEWREAQVFDEPGLKVTGSQSDVGVDKDDPGGPKDHPRRINPTRR